MAESITTKNITSVDEVQSVDNTDKVFVNDNGSFKQISVSNLMKQAPSGVTEETDPTVSAWAKQPTKPSYTADEVGALPVGTKIPTKTSDLTNDSGYLTQIPEEYVTETELGQKGYVIEDDIPEKLPSPGILTFTGAVNDTYDGSANKTINIPTGGGEGGTSDYNALANKPKLNGVEIAGNKTSTDYKIVSSEQGIENNGKFLGVGVDGNVTPVDKPTYTADEVGARPDTWTPSAEDVGALPNNTEIPSKTSDLENDSGFITNSDIPEKLPNPQKIIFTGAVTAEYDGSSQQTINIPTGGGSDPYTLPIMSNTQLGGGKAVVKTDEDVPVAVDPSTGQLFVPTYPENTGGGGGTVDPEQIKQAVNDYLEENPVSGMTAEQEQQLNQNTQDVADLKSSIGNINENGISSKIMAGIINLNMADAQNKYKAKGALGFSVLDDQLEKNVSKYILENGEKINGAPATREEIKDYLLNRDNCLKRGALHKNGIYLVDSDEVPVEIRGIGTHLLTAYTNMHTDEAIKTLKYYGVNCIRISVYIEDKYDTAPASGSSGTLWEGYLNDASNIKTEIEKIVDICIEQGLYCILDWHVMSGGGGGGALDLHQTEATEFFTYYAQKYADTPNVWYEFANEPFQTTYTDLANFVSSMRSIVKTYVDNPVMFTGVGRGGGVKETYSALSSLGIDDVFVSLHSYGTSYQANFTSLRNEGIPVCTTEWGIGAESGELTEGMIELAKGNLEYLHTEGILQCIWKFTDQEKASNWGILKLRDNTPNSEYYSHGGYIDELDLSEKGEILLGAFYDYAFSDWIERLTVAADRCIITYNLIGVSSSNNAKVVKEGESYSTTLAFLEGYNDIQTISITMGASDITSTVYDNDTHAINITHVSDDIAITVTAIRNPNIGRYPFKNGISNFTDGTKLTVSGGNHVKVERGTSFSGFANISDYEKNSNNPTSNLSAINNLPAFANVQSGDNIKLKLKNISILTDSKSGNNAFGVGVRGANTFNTIPNFTTGSRMTYLNYDDGIDIDATIDSTAGCGCIFIYLADVGLKTMEFDVEITVNGIKWV